MARNELTIEGEGILPTVNPEPRPSRRAREKTMSLRELKLQRFVGWVFCIPFYELIAFCLRMRGYKIENRAAIRRRYAEIVAECRRDGAPLVICANHLTFVDSCLLIWAFGSSFWYFRNYGAYMWNLPAGDFFKKKMIFRWVAYLSKCIFIHRDGSRDHKTAILEYCRQLVTSGEVVTIFPEGRRSRNPEGSFEAERVTHGVGKIVSGAPNCRVLCVYVRGDKQVAFSNYPPRDSRFDIKMEVLRPQVSAEGRRAYVEIVGQIGQTIKRLEGEYLRCRR